MKASYKRFFGAILTICMISTVFCTAASAVTVRSSNYLDSYVAAATAKSGGDIVVSATVNAIVNATQIGVSDIYIYESSDDEHFTCVEEYHHEDYPDMMGSGWYYHKDAITHEGTPGKYYYAAVYVYAGNSTGGDTRRYETASVRAFR